MESSVACGAGKASRIDAGRAAERFHLEAGIVCEQQAGGMRTVVQGLADRVLFKRRAIFQGGRQLLEARQEFDPDSRAVRRHAEFAQFARIPGGAVKRGQAPIISRCMTTNSVMPARARSII